MHEHELHPLAGAHASELARAGLEGVVSEGVDLVAQLESPKWLWVGAWRGQHLVGVHRGLIWGDYAQLTTVRVTEACRGRLVALLLARGLVDRARRAGLRGVQAWTGLRGRDRGALARRVGLTPAGSVLWRVILPPPGPGPVLALSDQPAGRGGMMPDVLPTSASALGVGEARHAVHIGLDGATALLSACPVDEPGELLGLQRAIRERIPGADGSIDFPVPAAALSLLAWLTAQGGRARSVGLMQSASMAWEAG